MLAATATARKRTHGRRRTPLTGVLLLVALCVGITLLASACIVDTVRGSGDLVTQDYSYDDFTGLEISNAFAVTVTQSDLFSVSVTTDDNVLDLVEVEQRGDILGIRLRGSARVISTALRATITMPQLEALQISGASRVTISGFTSTQDISFEASGASTIEGDIKCGDARFEVSGASKIELQGEAVDLLAEVSGASHLLLQDFPVTNARLDVSGASGATVDVSGRLDADVSGASKLRYLGDPTIGDVTTSGLSSLSRY